MHRFIHRHLRLGVVAVSCAALGAGASAIASAGASTTPRTTTAHPGRAVRRGSFALARDAPLARRTVDGTFVVATRAGFATVKLERGSVQSVSGQQLTITEGTPKQTYQTVMVTLPTTAQVRNNRQASSLGALIAGERVTVLQLPNRTIVVAHTPKSANAAKAG